MYLAAAVLVAFTVASSAFHYRVLSVIFGGLALTALTLGYFHILGTPSPYPEEGEILAFHPVENEAIYLWVQVDEPMNYRLPWDEEKAKEIYKNLKRSDNRGVPPTGKFNEGDYMVYPSPSKPLPEKGES